MEDQAKHEFINNLSTSLHLTRPPERKSCIIYILSLLLSLNSLPTHPLHPLPTPHQPTQSLHNLKIAHEEYKSLFPGMVNFESDSNISWMMIYSICPHSP